VQLGQVESCADAAERRVPAIGAVPAHSSVASIWNGSPTAAVVDSTSPFAASLQKAAKSA
jgi:hypothetical protein